MPTTFIPPALGGEVKSNAERKIFDALHKLKFSSCYVLHSLGLPRHVSKIYGEADFVLVCPRGVAILEIKGGRVARSSGKWIYTDRDGAEHEKSESPFDQAKGNMFSLMNELNELNSRLYGTELFKNMLCGFGVMFPDIEFKCKGEDTPQELVFDSRSEINSYINDLFDYWQSRPQSPKPELAQSQIELIAKILRPDFSYAPLLSSELNKTEKHLANLTREQVEILTGLSENPRLIIKGGAGTGKTLLASHHAVQCAEQKKKVLFLTFNKNLAKTVERHVQNTNIKIINIHAFFGEYIETSAEKIKSNPQEYFDCELPALFIDYVDSLSQEQKQKLQFDAIVIDEAQDIMRESILLALDSILKGGLANGNWAVFYDEAQNIYNQEFENGFALLASYSAAKFSLSINCRNTLQIGNFCAKKTGIEMKSFFQTEGKDVRALTYTTEKEFEKAVNKIFEELRAGKVQMSDITFLTPKSYKNSKLAALKIEFNELGENYKPDSPLPRYATIPGFKGLDSKIVVLAGLEDAAPEKFTQYFYIGCTRARTLLYVISKISPEQA